MKTLSKIVSRQDAQFKLSPCTSNETSINLPSEISELLGDSTGPITFKIFKDDFVKALGIICLYTHLYNKKEIETAKCNAKYSFLSVQLNAQFGDSDTSEYTVEHLIREDGRFYLRSLKVANGFSVRSFLIEQHSALSFTRTDDGETILRIITTMPQNLSLDDLPKEAVKQDNSDLPLQKIFYGAPGTGKSFTIDNVVDDYNSVRTTFHPDTDYASFVGAYKPTMEFVPISYVSEGKAKYAQPFGEHIGKERKIVYKYVPQAFLKAYTAAWKYYLLGKPYFLVIEEINRGNCAQIFGDLFQLLDRNILGSSSYPISADEDIRQYLAGFFKEPASEDHPEYLTDEERDAIRRFFLGKDNGKQVNIGVQILNGSKLLLPPNLHIWATMNTSDQSLFPIDSAFKRRWDWEYMPIVYNPTDKCTGQPIEWRFCIGDKLYSWGDFLKKINPEIYILTESSDKQMGYFFAKADPKTDIISENVFLNKVLFYLWTDVFKDYAIDSKAFQSEDLKRPFRFTDFFENSANILALLKNLEVESIEDRNGIAEYNSDDDSDDDSGRDYTKYRINGTGRYSKKNLAAELVRRYIDANPEKSAFEVVKEWKTLGNIVTHFIELQEEFETRTDKTLRVEKLECNGKNIYVSTNGWGGTDKIKQLKQAVESKDWGLTITEYPNETTD